MCDVQKEKAYYFCKEDRTAAKMLTSTNRLFIWTVTRKYKMQNKNSCSDETVNGLHVYYVAV